MPLAQLSSTSGSRERLLRRRAGQKLTAGKGTRAMGVRLSLKLSSTGEPCHFLYPSAIYSELIMRLSSNTTIQMYLSANRVYVNIFSNASNRGIFYSEINKIFADIGN